MPLASPSPQTIAGPAARAGHYDENYRIVTEERDQSDYGGNSKLKSRIGQPERLFRAIIRVKAVDLAVAVAERLPFRQMALAPAAR